MRQADYSFDTLSYANRLREAGCGEKLAEVQANEQAEIITMLRNEQVLTKADIKNLEQGQRSLEVEMLKIHQSIEILRQENRQALLETKQELKNELKEMNQKHELFQVKVEDMFKGLLIKLGIALVVIVGLFHSLDHFI